VDNLDDKTADFRFDFTPFKTCSKTILLSSLASVIAAKDREKKDDYIPGKTKHLMEVTGR
jgi:hypothetical protein